MINLFYVLLLPTVFSLSLYFHFSTFAAGNPAMHGFAGNSEKTRAAVQQRWEN
jgi:hypothetical protein